MEAKRATDELNSTQQQISELQKTLADLNKTYEEAMEKKRVIEEETAIMERRKIGTSITPYPHPRLIFSLQLLINSSLVYLPRSNGEYIH